MPRQSSRLSWAAIMAVVAAVTMPFILFAGNRDRGEHGDAGSSAPPASIEPSLRSAAQDPVPMPPAGSEGRLAYIDPKSRVVVQPMPSGAPVAIRHEGGHRTPRWSPSGHYLAFVEDGFLTVLDEAGNGIRLGDVDRDETWGWSPTADVLVYYTRNGMVLWDAPTGGQRVLRGQGAPKPEQPGAVIWSPDGTRILYGLAGEFSTVGGRSVSEMRVLDVRTSEDRLLIDRETPPQSQAAPLGWSGDGEWVLYRDAGTFADSAWVDAVALYVMPAGGGAPARLGTSLGASERGLFAANARGGRTAYVDGGTRFAAGGCPDAGPRRIALVANGAVEELEGAAPGVHSGVAWSADGGRLAYVAMPEPPPNPATPQESARILMAHKLWVQAPNGPAVQLTDDPAYRDEHPLWSRDGQSILFTRMDTTGKASVWRVSASGGGAQRVVDGLGLGSEGAGGVYGWIRWGALLDWWQDWR